jgi:uncharacterized SAM-dependent methyltransferase
VTKVFLSHSSEDITVVAQFVHLLEDGIGLERTEIRCSSLQGYGLPLGSPFRDAIRDDIEAADAVLALVSPSFIKSAYCMGEIGIAWGLRKQLIPLLLPTVTPGDIRGPLDSLVVSNVSDTGALDTLWEELSKRGGRVRDPVRWHDRKNQFLTGLQMQAQVGHDTWRHRGFWSERVVDGALYIASDLLTIGLRQQVLDAMEGGRPFPPHLFYASDQGVGRWLALSEDPLFVAYQDSMELIFRSSDEIAREILQLTGSQDIDLISLGPGDGRKDSALLGSLLRLAEGRGETFYYPFDISSNMVAKTMERIARDRVIRDGLAQAKAVIAHFDSLPIFRPVYQYREGPNVLILLGNMLGNFSDDFGFLRRLHDRAMLQEDVLLLEVRLRSHTEELEDMAQHHTLQAATRFDFGPLELLGVPFQEDKLSYSFEPDRGTIRGSDTIVAQYADAVVDGRHFRNIDLSYVHRYEEEGFLSEVRRAGFRVARTWTSPRNQNLWLLLQKHGTDQQES